MSRCAIVGVGLTKFGKHVDVPMKTMAAEAIEAALIDAAIDPGEIDAVYFANSLSAVITGQVAVVGQVALGDTGIHGVPVYNIDNACAGSSTAVTLATHSVRAGAAEVVLVVGAEKMYAADKATTFRGLNGAADLEWVKTTGTDVERESVFVTKVYADRLRDYEAMRELDATTLARIAVKNRSHAAKNPLAQYRDPLTIDEVLAARPVIPPVTALMCSPIADGASAAVIVSAKRASSDRRAVWIRGSAVSMGSPPPRERSTISRVAARAYAEAGLAPSEVDVAEVHDATAFSELLAYEELGFCHAGEGARLIEREETTLGGRIPVNPSGGLESRGHPLAATGVAQLAELTTQLRGEAGSRQVQGAAVAVAETAGGFTGGDSAAVAVTVLAREAPDA
jgi:acetyl-CoA acetyltransferase